jgi:hypothetical protein
MAPIIGAIIGAIVVLVGARVARNATRYAAELQAAQRRRDSELIVLKEFNDSVTALISATGLYVFAVKHMGLPAGRTWEQFLGTLSDEKKQQRLSLLMDLVAKREVSRALSRGLPWDDLREQYTILDTWAGQFRDDRFGDLLQWGKEHPNITNDLIAAIGERTRLLLFTYPVSAPRGRHWWNRKAQSTESAQTTPAVQQAGWVAEIPPNTAGEG